ncbi:MAG: asparagine synthase-related protein, partial [Gammaproteobacteria bacterium]|nr:asparagine synthase-related protein [Gammaproteobacteria bacterium]
MSNQLFLAASEPGVLLNHSKVSDEVDDIQVAAFFALRWPNIDNTYFRDIKELMSGHYLTVSSDRADVKQHWQFKFGEFSQFRKEEEVYEQFRYLLEQSVRARLRTHLPVAISMSGGLDSTGVTAMACRHADIKVFSWIFDELRECDERDNLESMIRWFGLDYEWIPGDDLFNLLSEPLSGFIENSPEVNPVHRLKQTLYETATVQGYRIMLVGDGADELYARRRYWLRDLLTVGHYA